MFHVLLLHEGKTKPPFQKKKQCDLEHLFFAHHYEKQSTVYGVPDTCHSLRFHKALARKGLRHLRGTQPRGSTVHCTGKILHTYFYFFLHIDILPICKSLSHVWVAITTGKARQMQGSRGVSNNGFKDSKLKRTLINRSWVRRGSSTTPIDSPSPIPKNLLRPLRPRQFLSIPIHFHFQHTIISIIF